MRTDIKMAARIPVLWLLVIAVSGLSGCSARPGQPGPVVEQFYAAAISGNADTAAQYLSRNHANNVDEIIGSATRGGTLTRVEIVSVDVWAEHGAHCEIKKTFADGSSQDARIEVTREAGAWIVSSGVPSL